MTIVVPTGQYYDSLETFGHLPGGPRGSTVSAVGGVAVRLAYRGAKYVVRRFLKPKKYTYRGAVGRGIGVGTLIASRLGDEFEGEVTDGPRPTNGKGTYRFKQRNRRQRKPARARRNYNNCKHCNCC